MSERAICDTCPSEEMIVVKSVEVEVVPMGRYEYAVKSVKAEVAPMGRYEYARWMNGPLHSARCVSSDASTQVAVEVVKGRRYTTPDGASVVLGLSEDAAKLLHIPLAHVDQQERELESAIQRARRLSDRLREITAAKWPERLRWLFFGVPWSKT